MNIIGFDTAMQALSVAVARIGDDGARDITGRFAPMPTGHAEALADRVRDVMAEAGVAFTELDRIAVTIGPGTFTGVRIGLSFARGLALATGAGLVALTTLEAIAANVRAGRAHGDDRAIAVASDARRDEVYFQIFTADLNAAMPPAVLPLADAADAMPDRPLTIAGTAAAALAELCDGKDSHEVLSHGALPDARVFAGLAGAREVATSPPSPLYLRPPDARLPGPGGTPARAASP